MFIYPTHISLKPTDFNYENISLLIYENIRVYWVNMMWMTHSVCECVCLHTIQYNRALIHISINSKLNAWFSRDFCLWFVERESKQIVIIPLVHCTNDAFDKSGKLHLVNRNKNKWLCVFVILWMWTMHLHKYIIWAFFSLLLRL